MLKMYVYDPESLLHIATIICQDNVDWYAVFLDRFGDDYAATASPAFGANDGLVENPDAEEIEA